RQRAGQLGPGRAEPAAHHRLPGDQPGPGPRGPDHPRGPGAHGDHPGWYAAARGEHPPDPPVDQPGPAGRAGLAAGRQPPADGDRRGPEHAPAGHPGRAGLPPGAQRPDVPRRPAADPARPPAGPRPGRGVRGRGAGPGRLGSPADPGPAQRGLDPTAIRASPANVETDSTCTARADGETRSACRGNRTRSAPGRDSKTSGESMTSASPSTPISTWATEVLSKRGAVHCIQPPNRLAWPTACSARNWLAAPASLMATATRPSTPSSIRSRVPIPPPNGTSW